MHCSVRSQEMTQREQAELQLIEENVVFDEEAGQVMFKYPVIGDLSWLGDNFSQVLTIEKKVKARLIKKGLLDDFNKELEGYLKCGAICEISTKEL